MSYANRLLNSTRLLKNNKTNLTKSQSYNSLSNFYTSWPRHLSTSSLNSNSVWQNLKKNLQEGQESNEKLRRAQQQIQESSEEYAKSTQKQAERMAKINQDSLSKASKTAAEVKKKIESISENESYKKFVDFSENTSKKLKDKGLKFKMPDMPNVDTKVVTEIRQAATTANEIGTSLMDVLDTAESYNRPDPPRKRKPDWLEGPYHNYEADSETTTAALHKDHFWHKRVDAVKDSRLGQKFSNFSATMEDSDNPLVRGAYMFTWKIKESMKINKETVTVVTEIRRVDPNFDLATFSELLQMDIIPNILEAACQGDEELLEDWCSESAAAVLIANKKLAAKEGVSYLRHIYSLQNLEFMDASIDDEADVPTLMFSGETQEIVALIDKKGQVIDGSLDKPMKNNSIFVFGRDMEEADPKAAWRLLEIQSSASKMAF